MKIRLNWALFLLTAASYIFYPVWHLPLPWPAQLALLNLFVLLSAAALYSPLGEVTLDASLPELRELWPVILLTAAVCLPFWLTPIPTGSDDQSHAGPAAWLVGRITSALGLNIRLLPAFFLPAAAIAAAAAVRLHKKGIKLPGRGAAVLALAAAGNLFFFASLRFGLADAVGRYETVLRYPPLSKFLYLPAYLLLGVNEAVPRAVQFSFMALAAIYMLRLLKLMKADPPPRLTYLLIAFFPTFFNLATSAELEAGTVFFFTASIFHFIKAAATGDREQFLKCAFWTAAGFFYKQLLLGLMLSFVPALAALWFIYPQRRADWAYALKTLAIPAVVGLPFIALSGAFGIRNTALVYSNLLDPQLMLLDLRNVYQTAGAAVTALLAVSAAAAVYRRRGLELALLLYFAVSYYLMISATAAVGYIRHAQPFYIALVLFLALCAADAARSRPLAKVPLYSAILALLVFQSVFARNPYQRKTAFNFSSNAFPYWEAVNYLKDLPKPGLKIFAPMEVEPSHFYLAKAGQAGKINWDRRLPPGFSAAEAEKIFGAGAYDYLLLPYSPFRGVEADFARAADELSASGGFSVVKVFDYHGNKLILLNRLPKPERSGS
ncbi:MAG: hypothetical protein Q7R35_12945 [Elusimicrobiota bacterium]|nr:hypothetical protein [Elusimicrobiota bacterium]